ncbi:TetR/AcrR family transcriptional regulator [Streptomyces sp. NPDC057654]|uniref:TetR/AcrR family transcriptional regulator n=1 Tax=Streptomyces sp. NPDC057654 TaxID=3346196 RepID=UPI003686A7B3
MTLSPNADQAAESAPDHRKGPRRRGQELEHAILKATLEELVEAGYAGMTMERVAARARTSKAALYRRWPGRPELVMDAVQKFGISQMTVPDTGTLRTDVIEVLRQMAAKMCTPFGGVMRGLLAEAAREPEFAKLIRERVHPAGPAVLRTVLERAAEAGEVEPWVLASRRVTVATDLLRNEFLLFGAPIEEETITDIVDEVYLPLILSPAPRRH